KRPGTAELLTTKVVSRPAQLLTLRSLGEELFRFYPCLFLIVGFLVLYQRLEDRNAWLLALLLVGFVAAGPIFFSEVPIKPWMRSYFAFFGISTLVLLPAIFNFFFAVFPVTSPLDRRLPWLKIILLLIAGTLAVVTGLIAIKVGSSRLWLTFVRA